MILNVRIVIKPLRLEQLSKKWKKAKCPVPNVIARILKEFLMDLDSVPEKIHPR